jgi:LysM repeat protein
LSAIARRYGVSLDALLDYNDLTTRSVIHAGQIIKIPPR